MIYYAIYVVKCLHGEAKVDVLIVKFRWVLIRREVISQW